MTSTTNFFNQSTINKVTPYNQNFCELQAYFNHQITEETLMLWMNNISEFSRKVIESKFGLLGDTKPCQSFKDFNAILGIDNSQEALETAIKELEEIKYLLVLADPEKFNKNFAIGLGRFAYAIEIAERNRDLLGEEILKEFKGLTVKEVSAIFYRFGISADGETHTQLDTAERAGYKSSEFTRSLEYKVGKHFRHPEVRRKISVYLTNSYNQKLEQEKLERIEKEKHPERYIPLSCLEEQNEFSYMITDAIRRANENFYYIHQVAASNPEEIAQELGLTLEQSEILCICARKFDFGRYLKLSAIFNKNLKSFNLSHKAEELLRRLHIYTAGDFLSLTVEKVSERPYTRKDIKEEILNAKQAFIDSFSSDWSIDDLTLSEKTLTVLRRNCVNTLRDLLELSEDRAEKMKGLTIAIKKDINSARARFGYAKI